MPLFDTVVPYKTTPNPDQPPTTTLQNPDQPPTTTLQNPDQISLINQSNSDDDEALIERLVHEAEITEEFNLDDSLQLEQINFDELLDTHINEHMHIDLTTDDNLPNDTNNPEETIDTKQQANTINTNNNFDTLKLNELTDNTTLDMHEQTGNTAHTDQQIPLTSNTNDPHTHTDKNKIHPNLTPQRNTDNPLPNTHGKDDFLNIPPNLVTSFKIIYALKLKLNKLQTNLTQLQEHETAKTLPPGLRIKLTPKFYLDKGLSDRWENTLTEASFELLNITIDHHKHCINDTKHKLQHRTQQLKLKCNEDLAQQIIEKTDSLFLKYTERALINAQKKTTKRIKRINNRQPKHTTRSQNQQGHITPAITTYNLKTPTFPYSTTKSTVDLGTPLSRGAQLPPPPTNRHTHAPTIDSRQLFSHNKQQHIASTSTPTTQQVALTPLMQINTTHQMTRLNTGLNTPTHMPKLRIPPLPHQPRNPLPHSLTSQQNNSGTQAHLTLAHKHNTPTNRSINNISPQVTHNIQSQIQNFLNHKAPKHKK